MSQYLHSHRMADAWHPHALLSRYKEVDLHVSAGHSCYPFARAPSTGTRDGRTPSLLQAAAHMLVRLRPCITPRAIPSLSVNQHWYPTLSLAWAWPYPWAGPSWSDRQRPIVSASFSSINTASRPLDSGRCVPAFADLCQSGEEGRGAKACVVLRASSTFHVNFSCTRTCEGFCSSLCTTVLLMSVHIG